MTPDQVRLTSEARKGKGPTKRLQTRKGIATHANLMQALGASSKAKVLAAAKASRAKLAGAK